MVGHLRRADRAEIDRVVVLDPIEAVGRHHQAGRAIEVRSPVEAVEGEFDPALALGDRRERLEAGGNDLLADPVARNDRDPIAPHETIRIVPSPGMRGVRSRLWKLTKLRLRCNQGGLRAFIAR